MSSFSARQTMMLVLLFVMTSAGFIALDNRGALDPIKTSLNDAMSPLARLFGGVGEDKPSTTAEQELASIRAERDALAAENARLRVVAEEVDQLRTQLQVQEENPNFIFLSARVINPDPTNLQKFITIDKGSLDGVQVGMAVVDPNYYVGQVTAVEEHAARVMLGIDASQRVGAELLESGATGIVYGMWQNGGRMEMRHLNRSVEPKDEEIVITTTSSDVRTAGVPGGLIIGKVDGEVMIDNQSDSLSINVLPVANFDNLKVVSVITNTVNPTPETQD